MLKTHKFSDLTNEGEKTHKYVLDFLMPFTLVRLVNKELIKSNFLVKCLFCSSESILVWPRFFVWNPLVKIYRNVLKFYYQKVNGLVGKN